MNNSPECVKLKDPSPKAFVRCVACDANSWHFPERKFFRFPKDPERSRQWAAACGKGSIINKSPNDLYRTSRLCSAHFVDSDFCTPKKHFLHVNAKPTKFGRTDDGKLDPSQLAMKLSCKLQQATTSSSSTIADYAFETPKRSMKNKNVTPKTLKIRQLSHKLAYIKKKYSVTKCNKVTIEKTLQLIRPLVNPIIFTFIQSQIKASNISKYGRRWSLEDKNLCLQIYLSSPKAYNTLKAFLHLPSKPTLLKAISGIKLEPGFSVAVLNAIRLVAGKLKSQDKYCILSFDEITLKQSLSYDKQSDCIVGFEDYGSYTKPTVLPQYATHALVFMVRGLCKKWKQVIGYFFASHTTPGFMLHTLVMEALSKLFDCGLTPVAIVCDGGANNMMCYTKAMKVTEDRPYILCQDKKVFTLFDVPHLLKCLRNNFSRYDVKFKNDKIASWMHIKSMWEFDSKMTHRCAPKLTDRHVNVDCLGAMSVKLAAQIFSHSVASGLCYLSALGGLPASASHTADFCSDVNELFDSLNSRTLKHSNPCLSAVTKTSIHMKMWKEKMELIKSIEFQTKRKISFPSMFGWRLTLSAVQQLIPFLLEEVPFILMCRFNQDALENFFSVVRRRGGNNDHPTAYDFQQRMRMLMAQNIISTSKLSNCEPDNDTVLIPTELLTVIKNTEPLDGNDVNGMEIDFDAPVYPVADIILNNTDIDASIASTSHDVFSQNSSAYVAGYIAKRALKEFPCTSCETVLITKKSLDEHTYFLYFKEYDGVKDGLFYPSQQFTFTVCEMGERFSTIFNEICHQKDVKSKIISQLKPIDHEWLTCHLHEVKMWEYIVSSYTQLMIYHKLKELSKYLKNNRKAKRKLAKFH